MLFAEHDRSLDRVADLLGDRRRRRRRPCRPSHRTTNSSPPVRAIVSDARRARVSRYAISISTSSPVVVAEGVVHALELVEVAEQQREHVARARGVRERDARAGPSTRPGSASPVSESRRLRSMSASAASRRAVTLRAFVTMPCTTGSSSSSVDVVSNQCHAPSRSCRRSSIGGCGISDATSRPMRLSCTGRSDGVDQIALVRPGELARPVAERALDRGAAVRERAVDVGDEHDVAHAREQRLMPVLARLVGPRRAASVRSLGCRSRRLGNVPIVRFPTDPCEAGVGWVRAARSRRTQAN